MLRRLLTLASAVSLVLCVATVVIWSNAGDGKLDIGWANGQSNLIISIGGARGVVWVGCERIDRLRTDLLPPHARVALGVIIPPPGLRWRRFPPTGVSPLGPAPPADRRYAFGQDRVDVPALAASSWQAMAPAWQVVAATAVLPVLWLRRWVRSRALGARRLAAGLCPCCGYDLRATPGRCPECGKAPADPARPV